MWTHFFRDIGKIPKKFSILLLLIVVSPLEFNSSTNFVHANWTVVKLKLQEPFSDILFISYLKFCRIKSE